MTVYQRTSASWQTSAFQSCGEVNDILIDEHIEAATDVNRWRDCQLAARALWWGMLRDPYVREKYTREVKTARAVARAVARDVLPWNACGVWIAAGYARAILKDHGKDATRVPAAPPERPARSAMSRPKARRRGCRMALRPKSIRTLAALTLAICSCQTFGYKRFRPLEELCRSSPSEVISRYSTSAKNLGSTHVALGFLTCFVSVDFGLTAVSSCFLIWLETVRDQPVPTLPIAAFQWKPARLDWVSQGPDQRLFFEAPNEMPGATNVSRFGSKNLLHKKERAGTMPKLIAPAQIQRKLSLAVFSTSHVMIKDAHRSGARRI
jgi:hypothetical protein